MKLSLLVLVVLTLMVTAMTTSDAKPEVHPEVHRRLAADGEVDLLVTMCDPIKKIDDLHLTSSMTKEQNITAIKRMIHDTAPNCESLLQQVLQLVFGLVHILLGVGRPTSETIPISCECRILGATTDILQALLGQVPDESFIRANSIVELDEDAAVSVAEQDEDIPWGIEKISAPQVWDRGTRGSGVVIGIIDTGVNVQHEALRDNFRQSYGWYDPADNVPYPYDSHGHGTKVAGVAVGDKGTGVAPEAEWIACHGCKGGRCLESDLKKCGQWMLCPTDYWGNEDCSKAPDIISNSWGVGRYDDFFYCTVYAWERAGIVPVFAAGNSGSGCSSVESPGDYDVSIGIGALDVNNALRSSSARGPSAQRHTKPDFVAPGDGIRTTSRDSDTSYTTSSGTSMAAPYFSGAAALVMSEQPGLNAKMIKYIFSYNAKKDITVSSSTCGRPSDPSWKNDESGYGLINAYDAITSSQFQQFQ